MREELRTVYIADDNTVFLSKEECQLYERENQLVKVYDYKGNQLSLETEFEKIDIIVIEEDEGVEVFKKYFPVGCVDVDIPLFKGIFMYDYATDHWVSIGNFTEKYERVAKTYDTIIEKFPMES